MRTQRICLASWAPFLAGAEVAAERLALGLQEAGHEVLVLLGTQGDALARMQAAGLRCEYVRLTLTDKWHWLRYRTAQRRVGKLLDSFRPDLVHSNDLPSGQMIGQAVRERGIPHVCHHRWLFEGTAIDWLNKFGADRHLFVSRALMDYLTERSEKLRSAPRQVVYDGLPMPALPTEADRRKARESLGLADDKTLVLFAGQVIERKGVADLICAWSMLPAALRERADLLIVGEDMLTQGEYRRKMEKLANDTEVPARFAGFSKDVPQWLTACDIAVVPSHTEPLGNATLEAMAHGLPVIGSSVGGIPEMILNEETGLLVPAHAPAELAAGLERLLVDAKLRRRLGQRARERCERHFSLDAHVDAVVQEYARLLDSRRSKTVPAAAAARP